MYFLYILVRLEKDINCVAQSQHYAGVAFDAGQRLSNSERNGLWNTANNSRSVDIC